MTLRPGTSSLCLLATLLAPLLNACGSYDFTVNDKVVYTPEPLFTDYSVPDEGLRKCLKSAINDAKATEAREVLTLSCAEAGIETLAGLSTFVGLQQVTLSSNNIMEINELAALSSLQVLYLDGNQIIDPVPLYELPALQRVDLSDNPNLLCPASGSLLRVSEVTLPEHCR